jgi:hypothetical protein
MLSDAVAADLGEIGRQNPGVLLGERLSLKLLDEGLIILKRATIG